MKRRLRLASIVLSIFLLHCLPHASLADRFGNRKGLSDLVQKWVVVEEMYTKGE